MGPDNPHRWYIAHNFTLYGHMIAALETGDVVEVDGVKWCVVDRYIVKQHANTSTVFEAIGRNHTIFQTCVSSWSDDMWLVVAEKAK